MTIKMTLAALVAISLSGAAFATETPDVPLQLAGPSSFDGPATPKHRVWVDDAPLAPASMQTALGSAVFDSLAANAAAFSKDETATLSGGGDDVGAGAISILAFILGVIPGFGIGHLVGGSIFGFVTWLCVDIVIGVLLFWVFPILIFPTFQFMYLISVIAVVIERVFEGYSAFRAAYWNYGAGRFHDGGPGPRAYNYDSSGLVSEAPNVVSLRF
jgi:hypothetical protein